MELWCVSDFCASVLVALLVFFFFNDTATTEIYTLSLHDALPIWLHLFFRRCVLAGDSMVCRQPDRKSTRLNSSHITISYAVFCLKKKKKKTNKKKKKKKKKKTNKIKKQQKNN